jgi:TPR repeat protein
MYQNGDGVPLDLSQAAEWYRKAASDGNPEAKEHLDRLLADDNKMSGDSP